ncbi:MAG: hypothetical protein QXS74_09660 [Nitrososphaeria archaeon]
MSYSKWGEPVAVFKVFIVDQNGDRLPDVEVYIYCVQSGVRGYKVTDNNGYVEFQGGLGLDYCICARKLGYSDYPDWTLIGSVHNTEWKVYVFQGQLTYKGEMTPPQPQYCNIKIHVYDAYTFKDIDGALCLLDGLSQTTSKGYAYFNNIEVKQYTLRVSKEGYKTHEVTIDAVDGLEVGIGLIPTVNVSLTLNVSKDEIFEGEQIVLSGTLTLNGIGYSNVISLYELFASGERKIIATTTSNDNGNFTFTLTPSIGLHSYICETYIYNTYYYSNMVNVNVKEKAIIPPIPPTPPTPPTPVTPEQKIEWVLLKVKEYPQAKTYVGKAVREEIQFLVDPLKLLGDWKSWASTGLIEEIERNAKANGATLLRLEIYAGSQDVLFGLIKYPAIKVVSYHYGSIVLVLILLITLAFFVFLILHDFKEIDWGKVATGLSLPLLLVLGGILLLTRDREGKK